MTETIIIEPGRLERNYWLDLWRYRELFRVLAWRDLAVRYKQTVIGVAWSVIRPLLLSVSLGKPWRSAARMKTRRISPVSRRTIETERPITGSPVVCFAPQRSCSGGTRVRE